MSLACSSKESLLYKFILQYYTYVVHTTLVYVCSAAIFTIDNLIYLVNLSWSSLKWHSFSSCSPSFYENILYCDRKWSNMLLVRFLPFVFKYSLERHLWIRILNSVALYIPKACLSLQRVVVMCYSSVTVKSVSCNQDAVILPWTVNHLCFDQGVQRLQCPSHSVNL